MQDQLQKQIERVEKRYRRLRFLQWLSFAMILYGICSWLLQQSIAAGRFNSEHAIFTLSVFTIASVLTLALAASRHRLSRRTIATRIESEFPDLDQQLLTALSLSETPSSYLEIEVIRRTIEHSQLNDWNSVVSRARMQRSTLLCIASLIFCGFSFLKTLEYQAPLPASATTDADTSAPSPSIIVEPGDVEVEAGTQIVITARYPNEAPNQATLQITDTDGSTRTYMMAKNLDDPLVGIVLPSVDHGFEYQVIDEEWSSPTYHASVYKHPQMLTSNATVQYPDYTQLEEKQIKDTIRVSAVEGSKVTWEIYLNKEVAEATLYDESSGVNLTLDKDADLPQRYTAEIRLDQTQKFTLSLLDHEGRKNKYPPELVARIIKNDPPNLKPTLAGDSTVSPLEELPVAAEVNDDFGILQFGLTYSFADNPPQDILLGAGIEKGEKQSAEHLIAFEELEAAPDDLLTYHFWAEDHAPDGSIRRSESDLFFAEVRPFDEIFRERNQQQDAAQADSSQQESQNGQEAEELANLQKEIINATWRLLREQDNRSQDSEFINDLNLVIESQNQAFAQAQEMSAELSDEKSQRYLQVALESMQEAVSSLQSLVDDPASATLREALTAETAAYSSLLKLRAREFEVTQSQQSSQSSSSSSSSSQNRRQRQLEELELDQNEDRYETESQAGEDQQQQENDRENRQVLNRLRELARRQQDLNDAMAELQSSLDSEDEAKQQAEAQRQLKRLREQQQELLRETDELAERLQQNSDQQEMNDAAEQLEQTREQVQQAAQQLAENNASEALTSGRRAEREFEAMREDFRQRSSGQFNEKMRELQADAEALRNQQQEITQQMEQNQQPDGSSGLRSEQTERTEVSDRLRQQAKQLEELLQEMQETVEQSEESEPLLAQKLYDAFRETMQNQTTERLQESANLLDRGFQPQSRDLTDSATQSIENLQQKLDQAAESILGDEVSGLQVALSELETLEAELRNEINQKAQPDVSENNGRDNGPESAQNETATNQGSETPSDSAARGSGQNDAENEVGGSMEGEQAAAESQPADDTNPPNPAEQNPAEQNPSETGSPNPSSSSQNNPNEGQASGGSTNNPAPPSSPSSPGTGSDQEATTSPNQPPTSSGGPAGPSDEISPGSILNQLAAGNPTGNPLTGEGYRDWSDRLRDVEEMVSDPELRSEAAQIRDRAREIRRETRRQSKDPQWDVVEEMVATPLRELKKRVSDELMRRSAEKNAVVPLDRDPVPSQYQDAVRTYYERLGSGK